MRRQENGQYISTILQFKKFFLDRLTNKAGWQIIWQLLRCVNSRVNKEKRIHTFSKEGITFRAQVTVKIRLQDLINIIHPKCLSEYICWSVTTPTIRAKDVKIQTFNINRQEINDLATRKKLIQYVIKPTNWNTINPNKWRGTH